MTFSSYSSDKLVAYPLEIQFAHCCYVFRYCQLSAC